MIVRLFKRAINWLTGGRPMRFSRMAFRDVVTGEMVCYYIDGYGRWWMATNRWALFRVKVSGIPNWDGHMIDKEDWDNAR